MHESSSLKSSKAAALAVLVALLSERAVALGGTNAGPTGQPPGILTGPHPEGM
jgi:hypothetical protein